MKYSTLFALFAYVVIGCSGEVDPRPGLPPSPPLVPGYDGVPSVINTTIGPDGDPLGVTPDGGVVSDGGGDGSDDDDSCPGLRLGHYKELGNGNGKGKALGHDKDCDEDKDKDKEDHDQSDKDE